MSVEERVREALAARAGLITADRLQPAIPPTMGTSRPARGVRWLPILAAAAAAVAVLFTVILLVRPGTDVPAGPVTPPPVSTTPQPAKKSPSAPVSPGPGTPARAGSPPAGSPPGGSKLSPAIPPSGR